MRHVDSEVLYVWRGATREMVEDGGQDGEIRDESAQR
jgi:hypothetical protein